MVFFLSLFTLLSLSVFGVPSPQNSIQTTQTSQVYVVDQGYTSVGTVKQYKTYYQDGTSIYTVMTGSSRLNAPKVVQTGNPQVVLASGNGVFVKKSWSFDCNGVKGTMRITSEEISNIYVIEWNGRVFVMEADYTSSTYSWSSNGVVRARASTTETAVFIASSAWTVHVYDNCEFPDALILLTMVNSSH